MWFVQIVVIPKFVGPVDVIVPVVYMGVPGGVESLSESEDVSFDENSVGTDLVSRVGKMEKGTMLTWTGRRVVQTLFQVEVVRTFTSMSMITKTLNQTSENSHLEPSPLLPPVLDLSSLS